MNSSTRRAGVGSCRPGVRQSIPTLSLADLPGLASRLSLPAGWRYEPRTPTSTLRVDTTNSDASVTQDDLANSYSLQADP